MWSSDYEDLFLAIRLNSVHMSRIHKLNYFRIKNQSNYFRIPTIVFSALASVISVGAEPYINQQNISGLVCLINMSIGIINSIELYLKLQERMEQELEHSKSWYKLATDIFTLTEISEVNRDGTPKDYLNKFYSEYIALFEKSSLTGINYKDKLLGVTKVGKLLGSDSTIGSSSSSSSSSTPTQSPLPVFEEQI
jgi:hypothetical protein